MIPLQMVNIRNLIVHGLISLACLSSASIGWATDTTLGETVEIKYNPSAAPELNAKATALGSPVKIYEYVRNQYDYSLYHGARSGSINTFLGGVGNDVDLAATLIAMLRSQGVPARYVVGTVRVPTAKVMNWLSVKNADLAYGLMRDQGTQGVVLSTDKTTMNFEHVWVEALVPHTNYRGVRAVSVDCSVTPVPTTCNWVALDPSFKQRLTRNSGLDPYSSLTFDYTAYYNALASGDVSKRDKNPLEIYQEQVLSWLRANAPGKTLEDISDFMGIVPEENGLLPASLPYEVVSSLRRYASMADHDAVVPAIEPKRWGKKISIGYQFGGITFTQGFITLVEASTQRLTSNFVAGAGTNPAKQSLRLGGVEISSISIGGTLNGQSIQQGTPFTLVVTIDGAPAPDASGTDQAISASYQGVVGGYYYIATGGETSNWSQVHRAAQQLLAANQQYRIVFNTNESGCSSDGTGCTPYIDANGNGWDSTDPRLLDSYDAMDALTGGLLYVAGTQYYAALRDGLTTIDKINKVKTPIVGFIGVVSSVYDVEYVGGTAFSILPGGLLIDIKGINVRGPWRIDQPASVSQSQFELFGHIGSSLEHETWQALTGYDAISTVRGMQLALANGASLVNPKKNASVDTMLSSYPQFGFSIGSAPTGFAYVPFDLFGTQPATWTHAVSGQKLEVMKSVVNTSTPANQLPVVRYTYLPTAGLYGWVNCVNSWKDFLQLYSAYFLSETFCDGSYHSGPGSTLLGELQSAYINTYIPRYIGQAGFDFFDRAKGFDPSNYVFRSSPPALDAQSREMVGTIRNDLYLRDLNQYWIEYLIPSKLSVGPYYRFSVYIRKAYESSSGNEVQATYAIQNLSGVPAGGGYVALPSKDRKFGTAISSIAGGKAE